MTKKNVAVLGGTFDPVHNGHVQIVRHLTEVFDKVVVMPNKLSPFKLQQQSANDKDRLAMLRLALAGMEGVEISDYEIASGGISYSYVTARHLAADDVSLTYVIGSDMLYGLPKWKNFSELAKTVNFYVIGREGFDFRPLGYHTPQLGAEGCRKAAGSGLALGSDTGHIPSGLIEEYKRLGAKIKFSELTVSDYSSSMIKVAIALDRAGEFLCREVQEYINRWQLYDDYRYITNRYNEFGLKPERIEHTYRAAKEAIRLAKIHNVDTADATTAMLLHDIAKYISPKEVAKKYQLSIQLDKNIPPSCIHAPLGAEVARHCFGINNESIQNAIKTHTTCAPFMDELAKIVAIADFIEEGRSFEGLQQIRDAASIDLDEAMELMLKSTIDYLSGKQLDPITQNAYDYFRIINSSKAASRGNQQ